MPVILSLLCCLLVFSSTLAGAEEERSFLGYQLNNLIDSVDRVGIQDITAMKHTPMILPAQATSNYHFLNAAERNSLRQLLVAAKEVDPKVRLNQCLYEPGLRFGFFKGETLVLTILLCFNCDVWAVPVGYGAGRDGEVLTFGDSKAARAEMLELAKRIFPNAHSLTGKMNWPEK